MTRNLTVAVVVCAGSLALVHAQAAKPKAPAAAPKAEQKAEQKAEGPAAVLDLTAASANVKEPGSPVKIHLIRWSTDEERTPLLTALNPPARGGGRGAGAAGGGARGAGAAAGAADGGRAGAAPAAPAAGRAGGRGGRGGRGAAAPQTPIEAFTAALAKAPTLGYIWTSDVTGYSIKYAWHAPLAAGGERIVLASDRRLGAYAPAWAPTATTPPTDYEFTVLELHLDPKGVGEGKTSLVTKVVVDSDAKTIGLEDYAAAPAILQRIKR